MHIGSNPSVLPYLLGRAGPLPAAFARDGAAIEAGRIYVAPRFGVRQHSIELWAESPLHPPRCRPSIHLRRRSLRAGIVLSGGGSDGATGLRAIAEHGGMALVRDPKEAESPSMAARGHARRIMPMPA